MKNAPLMLEEKVLGAIVRAGVPIRASALANRFSLKKTNPEFLASIQPGA
jgi:hypothetical protein